MQVRRMTPDDVAAAAAVAYAALAAPGDEPDPARVAWGEHRTAHMQVTDPGGAWVAEQDGRIVGMALAIIRDDVWGLSLLGVDPAVQARGAGSSLLKATLEYGKLAQGQIILSSSDPKAMRIYHRAGFDLRPSVSLGGIPDREKLAPPALAQPTTDVEAMAPLGRLVRGGAYGPHDLQLMLDRGAQAFLVKGRGFAICLDGSPKLLVADSGGVGQDLLRACLLSANRGATIDVEFVTAGNDWALEAGLEVGLAITPGGPVFTRGDLGPLRAWLPSGALL